MNSKVHFQSNTDEWSTPLDLFKTLDSEFGFTLDPCATPENAKCQHFYTLLDDGLSQSWSGVVFMNPPYGHVIGLWVRKAFEESRNGATVVCLIPSRTDTTYWHDYVMQADEVRLIRGRLKFGGGQSPAPFPSAIVVFYSRAHLTRVLADADPRAFSLNAPRVVSVTVTGSRLERG